ncbi:MAG: leucine-rich repeat domain-containing protein, partial [Clostridia bacterium]|nr:leucine-rich repeat domain-containing protein [Clostridia bacterium]
MKKFIFISFTILLISAFAFAVSAGSVGQDKVGGQCGDNVTWSFDPDTGALDFVGTGPMYDYTINMSSYVSDVPWWHYRSSVKTVTFSEGITYIGNSTVYNCKNLKSVSIPGTVKGIGMDCFASDNLLEAVYITDLDAWMDITFNSMGANPLYLAHNLYLNGEPVEEVVIPEGMAEFKRYIFTSCYTLKSIYFPDSLEKINLHSMIWSKNLKTVRFGKNLQSIDIYAFFGCDSLTDVFYDGTAEAWNNIPKGDHNDPLLGASFHSLCATHTFGALRVDSLPTCTEPGRNKRICMFCQYTLYIPVDPLGHDYSEWYDYGSDGTEEARVCARCGQIETREKTPAAEIALEKIRAYDVKLTGLDPRLAYTVRYATGEYTDAGSVKRGLNAGFVQVSGVNETTVSLPTHGVHTVSVQVGAEQKYISTVTIDVSDMKKEVSAQVNDLNIRVDDLYGADQIRLYQNGNVALKVPSRSFISDGLKYRTEFTAPGEGDYIVRVIFNDGDTVDKSVTVTAPGIMVNTNGRVFTLSDYEPGKISYIRFAKGVYNSANGIKSAPGLRTFGAKYFRSPEAAFAALDAVNGQTDTYTVQVGYVSGFTKFVQFEIAPTVPIITAGNGCITLSNVISDSYTIDWVRCAPGTLSSLYAIRHAAGSKV